MSNHGFRPKVTSCVLSSVQEILSPNLDHSTSVLWSIVRIDSFDNSGLVILEFCSIRRVWEVSKKRNHEWNFLINVRFRSIIALQAPGSLKNKMNLRQEYLLCWGGFLQIYRLSRALLCNEHKKHLLSCHFFRIYILGLDTEATCFRRDLLWPKLL